MKAPTASSIIGDHAAAEPTALKELPVIDISALCTDAISAELDATDVLSTATQRALENVAQSIHHAATHLGFFYISGHGIHADVIDNALHATKAFFALPQDQKESVLVNQQQRGWMPAGMAKLEGSVTHDLKEVFFYGAETSQQDPDLLAGVPLVALNQWPDESLAQLRVHIVSYQQALCRVGRRVLSAIAVGFGQPHSAFHASYERPLARGQLVYYPPQQPDDEREHRFGVAPHTDFGVLTLLYQDNSGGLQVKTRAGQWIEAHPIDGTLVCNTGDLLQRWTNDRFLSTVHRVINRSGKERFSMPLFYDPAATAIIDPVHLGVDSSAAKHTPITTGDHIQSRNRRNFAQYKK